MEYRKLDQPEEFDYQLEEKYMGAKALVKDAEKKLFNISNSESYYRIFGTDGEQKVDIEFAKKVVVRVQMYCADIQELYFDNERRTHDAR